MPRLPMMLLAHLNPTPFRPSVALAKTLRRRSGWIG